jgi:hypothetical protein
VEENGTVKEYLRATDRYRHAELAASPRIHAQPFLATTSPNRRGVYFRLLLQTSCAQRSEFVGVAHVAHWSRTRSHLTGRAKQGCFARSVQGRIYSGPENGYAFWTSYIISRFAPSVLQP